MVNKTMNRSSLLIVLLCVLCVAQGTSRLLYGEKKIYSVVKAESRPTCRAALSECITNLDSGKADKCETLPVPPRSFLKQIAPGTFHLLELRKHVWMYNDGIYLSVIILKGKRLLLIDLPDTVNSNTETTSNGTLLTDAIQKILRKTVPTRIDMVYSHAHLDHIGAARRVFDFAAVKFPEARVFTWGTQESKDLVKKHKSNRAVPVTKLIRKPGRTIKLGRDLELKLMIVGGHTQEDLVILIPKTRRQKGIAIYVDVVLPGWSLPFNLGITQNLGAMVSAHKKLLKLNFEFLVPGHFRLGTKRDVRLQLDYLEELLATAKKLVGSNSPEALVEAGIAKTQDPSKREFRNIFYAVLINSELEIDACYRALIGKWGCQLASLDLFLRGHCLVALQYIVSDT